MNKLNLGCGAKHLPGYINIDVRVPKMKTPDYVCDIRTLPYKNNTIDEMQCHHVIEHMGRHEAKDAIKSWWKMLVDGGFLEVECPNVAISMQHFLNGDYDSINSIYGLQRNNEDYHKFGYTPESLTKLLLEIGFTKVIPVECDGGNIRFKAYK